MKVACFLLVVLVASSLVESQLLVGGNDMDDVPLVSPFSGGYSAVPVMGQPMARGVYGSNDMDDMVLPVSPVRGFRTIPVIGQPLSLGGYQPISGVPYGSMYSVPSYGRVYGRPLYRSRLARHSIIRRPIVRRRSYCC